MSWAGKTFHRMMDDIFQSGEIVEEVSPGLLLVRFDRFNQKTEKMFPEPEMVLIRVEDMIAKKCKDGTYDHDWDIFEDRKALDAFVEFIESLGDDEDEIPSASQVN